MNNPRWQGKTPGSHARERGGLTAMSRSAKESIVIVRTVDASSNSSKSPITEERNNDITLKFEVHSLEDAGQRQGLVNNVLNRNQ